MAIHTKEQFTAVVASLNKVFDGWMTFQLVGSLNEKPATYNDADIVVYPKLDSGFAGFLQGCKDGRIEIVKIDKKSTAPFPGRPDGQDRVQLKLASGQVVDLFFPKGYCTKS